MGFFDTILYPIKWVVAHIMVAAHNLFSWIGIDATSGANWVLSIVALVVVIRIVLIPLFVRQIKAQRMMQVVQPEIQKLQKKYKGKTDPASRQAMQQEMMAIYKDNGTSPFASCLPLLAQMPIFFSLFRVLNTLGPISRGEADPIGPLDQVTAKAAESSEIFGASLSSTFLGSGDNIEVKIVTAVLVVLMCATMLFQQKHLTQKNMPASALDNPMARQQKMLMYILPLVFAVSGVSFPIGVLLYWTTSNLWSMGQQFWVIHNSPTPGSPAAIALEERKARRAARRGKPVLEDDAATVVEEPERPVGGQRQQPKRKDRAKKGPSTVPPKAQEPKSVESTGSAKPDAAGTSPLEDGGSGGQASSNGTPSSKKNPAGKKSGKKK